MKKETKKQDLSIFKEHCHKVVEKHIKELSINKNYRREHKKPITALRENFINRIFEKEYKDKKDLIQNILKEFKTTFGSYKPRLSRNLTAKSDPLLTEDLFKKLKSEIFTSREILVDGGFKEENIDYFLELDIRELNYSRKLLLKKNMSKSLAILAIIRRKEAKERKVRLGL